MKMEEEEQQTHESVSSGNLNNSVQSTPINIQKHLQIESSRRVMMRRTKHVVLPDDIIYHDILIRLAAKYLVRFRLVCKAWKHNLSNPDFVKSHISRQQSVMDQDLLIGHRHWSLHGLVIISRSREIAVTVGPLRSDILLGSINGLVCMASGTDFSLWNPATGQAKEINLPNHDCKECRHLLGFSWDHVTDDYKVVIVCYVSRCSSKYLYIYSCRSASWTQMIVPKKVMRDRSMMAIGRKMAPSTIVKGLPYWSYPYQYGTKHMHANICVFTKNELRSLPHFDLDYSSDCKFNLVNIKDCLLGMVYESSCRDSFVDMYSLDEESDTGVWSMMYTIRPIDIRTQEWSMPQCFKNGGEILIVKVGQLCFYDPKTKETKSIWSSRYYFRSCYSYTPSLACVQGMESMTVLSFQEMKLKKSAQEYNDLVRRYGTSSGGSSSSSDSDSGASESDSDAETTPDSGTSPDSRTSTSDSDAETDSDTGSSSDSGTSTSESD